MGAFFVYILKSAVCLAGFYLFYRLLLSRDTFHRFNRAALLSLLVLSCTVPLVEVTVEQPTGVEQPFLTLEEMMLLTQWDEPVQVEVAVAPSVTWREVVLLVYVLGLGFFLLRNVWSLVRMLRLIKGSTMQKREDGITLITHRKRIAPFSWMKFVVISEQDLRENGCEILMHECAHIRNFHSIDLLVADVCIFFQWFNPAAWLLKQELQNIHEYEADESVIAQGIDAKCYQLLLIEKAVGSRLYSIANSFNDSSLKKRIAMMMRKKSNPWARAKYLYVLPLAAVAVAAFARPEVSNELKEISTVKVNDLTAMMKTDEVQRVETVAVPVPRDEKKVIKVKGRVQDDAFYSLPGVNIFIKGTQTSVVSGRYGDFTIEAPVGSTLVFSFPNTPSKEVEVLEKFADGKHRVKVVLDGRDDEGKAPDAAQLKAFKEQGEKRRSMWQKEMVAMMPEFPGGLSACYQFLNENIQYPEEAKKEFIQGRVTVRLTIEEDGSVTKPTLVQGPHPLLNHEALRVVSTMPKWKPAMQNGTPIRSTYDLQVLFDLKIDTNVKDIDVTAAVGEEKKAVEEVFQSVDEMPEYPGGMEGLFKFIGDNVKYPEAALEKMIIGRVIVQFVIEKDGSISSPRVVRSVSPDLDGEAIRVISIMPKWKPGMQNGQPVRVKYTVPIMFRREMPVPTEPFPEGKSGRISMGESNGDVGFALERGGKFSMTKPALIILDGAKVDSVAMTKISPDEVIGTSLLKGEEAIDKYGEEGKNGVIIINTNRK